MKMRRMNKRLEAIAISIKNVKLIEIAYDVKSLEGTVLKKGGKYHVTEVTSNEDGSFIMHLNCPLGKMGSLKFENEKQFDHYIIR